MARTASSKTTRNAKRTTTGRANADDAAVLALFNRYKEVMRLDDQASTSAGMYGVMIPAVAS